MLNFEKPEGWKVLELGGEGSPHPLSDVRVDFPSKGVPNVTHFVCDFNQTEWPEIGSEGFEIVLVRNILDASNLESVLRQVHRILKPGGKGLFRIPSIWMGTRIFSSFASVGFVNSTSFQTDEGYVIESQKAPPQSQPQSQLPIPPLQSFPLSGSLQPIHPSQPQTPFTPSSFEPKVGRELSSPPTPPKPHPDPSGTYNRKYFDSYAGGGFYWCYPHNEVFFRKVMERRPKSVLELGCARGYVLKKLQDSPAGIRTLGLDCSRHAWLTRVCDPINLRDLTLPDWPVGKKEFDLVLSLNFLEHVPEDCLETVLYEMGKTTSRGIHAVVVQGNEPSTDPTRCTVRSLDFWRKLFQSLGLTDHEIIDCKEFGSGDVPADYVDGDGRLKLNIGCAWTQFHHGWTNIDSIDAKVFASSFNYKFVQHDVRNGLPSYSTGVVDSIFASHFLEHLTYEEGIRFLRECRRIIRPSGGMRLVVPDTEQLITAHNFPNGLAQFDEVNEQCSHHSSRAGKLWSLLGEGHKSFYDRDMLSCQLQEAGWQPHAASFRVTSVLANEQILREGLEMGYGFSLFMDATPI